MQERKIKQQPKHRHASACVCRGHLYARWTYARVQVLRACVLKSARWLCSLYIASHAYAGCCVMRAHDARCRTCVTARDPSASNARAVSSSAAASDRFSRSRSLAASTACAFRRRYGSCGRRGWGGELLRGGFLGTGGGTFVAFREGRFREVSRACGAFRIRVVVSATGGGMRHKVMLTRDEGANAPAI